MTRPSTMDTPFISIENILCLGRPREFVVAWDGETALTWGDLISCVSGVVAQLERHDTKRWLVCCKSSFSFAASVLALWATRRVAVLPPNQQPGTLRETSRGLAGIVSDTDMEPFEDLLVVPPHPRPDPLPRAAHGRAQGTWGTKGADAGEGESSDPPFLGKYSLERHTQTPVLELFTSGTTGERKAVSKTLGQLGEEVKTLETVFGERLGCSLVLSTVSHQHIYGLLFRVLWPLCAGRPFDDHTHLFWEDLFAGREPNQAITLVTSPTHLDRLNTVPPAGGFRAVFSSGGKLRESTALKVSPLFGMTPTEVFGSTETGGVGWRQISADPDSQLWRPFPSVSLCLPEAGSDVLAVRSPLIGGSENLILLGDAGTIFPDGRFKVSGRVDRIVKVAEKRLSLDDLETRLSQHPFVSKVHVLLLGPAQGNEREGLGAVVQLSAEGHAFTEIQGKETLFQNFRTHLLKSFDPTLVPRRFRMVEIFPEDPQGKVPLVFLQGLFQPTFDKNVEHPVWLNREVSDKSMTMNAVVPENLGYFDGHFPGYPLVPGIVQIKWVIDAVEAWWGAEPAVERLEAIKFKRTLRPSQKFTLHIKDISEQEKKAVEFVYQDGGHVFSSGRVIGS